MIYLLLTKKKSPTNTSKRNQLAKNLFGISLFVQNAIHFKGILEINDLEVNSFNVPLKKLPQIWNNFTIAQLTDIHSSLYVSKDYLDSLVNKLNKLNPDLIVLTGDYITFDSSHVPKLMNALSRINKIEKTFAILGNHDYENDGKIFEDGFKSIKIKLLRNENLIIANSNYVKMNLIGLEDITQNIDLDKGIQGCSKDDINILLCHNPDFIEKAQNYPISLMISGHTHGGVFHIPGYGPVAAPSKFGAKYAYGLFKENNTHLFVSKGVGVNGIPFRFNCKPEIAILKLKTNA